MAKFTIGEKVTIPGTVVSLHESEDGTFYNVKVRAINSIKTLDFEEDDLVSSTTNNSTSSETTDTESNTTTEP